MGSRIFETFIGVLITLIGFILGYLCVSNPSNATPLRMILSVVMIPLGLGFLIRIGRKEEKFMFEKFEKKEKSLVEQNIERAKEYDKNANTRNKLKMLRHL